MRQLDLFGSLFDPPPSEENAKEQKPVEKAGTTQPLTKAREEPPPVPSYLLSANKLKPGLAEGKTKTSDDQNVPSVSLAHPGISEEITAVEPIEALVEEPAFEPNANIPGKEKEEDNNPKTRRNEELADASEPVPAPVVSLQETPAAITRTKPVQKKKGLTENKKATGSNLKADKPQPELLQAPRNIGPVVFDDGKISVKIKAREVLPEPVVVKEKLIKTPQKRGRKSFKEIDAEVDLIDVPDDEILFQKQYYPISEVAKWFRVNTSLLRFWENEFEVLKPRKNRKGDRLFRPEDIKNLQLIYQLLRQRKYTIEGAREYIKSHKKKADIQQQLTSTLQKFKSFLLDLKANLQP